MGLYEKASNLVFPKRCASCGEMIKDGFLCFSCKAVYDSEITDGCLRCGNEHVFCRCDALHLKSDEMIYCLPYKEEGVSRELLLKLKTSRPREVLDELGSRMASALRQNGISEGWTVAYVPRSSKKIRTEGTDQARNLAHKVASLMELEIINCFLCRDSGVEQKELVYRGRKINAEKRFSLRLGAENKIEGKRIVLVDDIITSGATAKICSELLTEAGAAEVICLGAGRSVSYL